MQPIGATLKASTTCGSRHYQRRAHPDLLLSCSGLYAMLTLQWPASSIEDFDALLNLENALEQALGTSAEVDGHDCGSGQMNVFIYTDTRPCLGQGAGITRRESELGPGACRVPRSHRRGLPSPLATWPDHLRGQVTPAPPRRGCEATARAGQPHPARPASKCRFFTRGTVQTVGAVPAGTTTRR